MKILVPVIAYEPSSLFCAFVVTWPRSEPHCGSVRHMVPVNSPEIILAAYLSLSSSEPCASRVLMAPFERPGNMRNVQLAAAIKSACTIASDIGSPCPPYFSG